MFDLTAMATTICRTNEEWSTTVPGSKKGTEYRVWWGRLSEARQDVEGVLYGWSCTCPGFKYRSKCRHVREVNLSGQRCGWNWELEPTREPAWKDGEARCPECGGETVGMMVGV